MTDLVARVLLKADASGLVGQSREGKAAIEQLAAATVSAGTDARALAAGTAAAATGVLETATAATTAAGAADNLAGASRQAGSAAKALATDQRQVLAATAELGGQLDQATARTGALEAANGQLTRELRDTQGEVGKLATELRQAQDASAALAAATVAAGTDTRAFAAGTAAAAAGVHETTAAATAAAGAADNLAGANRQAGSAAQALAVDQRQVIAATVELRGQLDQTTARTVALEAANGQLAGELRDAQGEVGRLATELRQAQEASSALAGRIDVLETRLKGQTRAHREAGDEANRHQFAVRNLGQQFGDLGLSIAGGISPARAFGQQAGQIGYAMSEMGGKAGKVGAFLTGPWGIALTIATAVLAPFVEELLKAGEAAEAAKIGADGLSDAQSVLGGIFDLTSGKIKSQNELLILNARLTAINLRGEAAKARQSSKQTLDDSGKISVGDRVRGFFQGEGLFLNTNDDGLGGIGGAIRGTERGSTNARNMAGIAAGLRSGRYTPEAALRASEKLDFTGTKVTREQFQQAIIDQASSGAKDRIADLIDQSLDDKKLASGLKRDAPKKRTPKPKSTAARDEFGEDAADRIAAVTAQFDDTAPALRKTNVEVAKLDDLIDDLSRKKPPGFEGLIASAEKAKTVVRRGLIDDVAEAFAKPKTLADQARVAFGQLDAIAADLEKRRPPNFEPLLASVGDARAAIQDGLNRPLRDFVEQQQESFAVGRLLAEGKVAEAEALREINRLEHERGPLTEAQKDAVLATTQALAAQERQIERNRQRQQVYLDALGDMRAVVQAATQDFARGDLGQLIKSPKRLLDAFSSLKGAEIFDRMFEGAFSELKDQITGTSVVEDASARMADAVDAVSGQTRQTTTALADLQAAASGAAGAVRGGASAAQTAPAPASPAAPTATGIDPVGASDDIVVTGRRERLSPDKLFTEGLGKISTSIAGLFTNEESAKNIGVNIGKYAGRGLEGAATGTFVSGIANSLGLKLNGTGAQIGGAIGGVTGLPGGQIIGSVLGGLVGGLFGKKKDYGTATLTGTAVVNGAGNDQASAKVATGLAATVQDSVAQIAQQLGGTIGNYLVSVGTYDGDYRVSTSGQTGELSFGKKNKSKATLHDFGDDQAGAIAFAVADAIKDGAVQGLSPAVAKALQSSSDVNKAIAEASKVQQLETALGGLQGQLAAVFKQADTEAAERVRLAKAYGLDLLAVEKLNAEQRADLLDQTLKARVGGLKDLLSNFSYGDLFEGSAAERRTAILGEIDDAKVDADAGVEGAADRLAELYRQLVTTSKEAFGTAGSEYAADRDTAIAGVERAIQIEEDRVKAASASQAAATKAIENVATLTNEGNDLMVQQNDILTQIAGSVSGGGGFRGADLGLVGRVAV